MRIVNGRKLLLAGILIFWPSIAFTQQNQTFTMALTGDAIITRKLSVYQEPKFLNMIELLRSADVAFTNLEMLFHDYEPYPMQQSGGTYMRAEPALAKDLAWAGFDLVARANNHSGDYGVLGMNLTTKYVAEAGLVQAGVGASLAEAREAKFLETAKARVALISCSSSFPDHSRAGKSRDDIPPRPGLNPLRYRTTFTVTGEQLAMLKKMRSDLGFRANAWYRPAEKENELRFLRQRFVKGDTPGVHTEANRQDLEEIAAVVRNASQLSEYTILTIHAHASQGSDRFTPAEFLIPFAHAMIDAGTDVFVGHGPHVLRGIEIYKGKPIFYSLGDFIFQNETLLRLPFENYEPYNLDAKNHVADFNAARYANDTKGFPTQQEIWESVIAVPAWEGDKLVEIKLYPITLGFGKPRTVRGRPMLAKKKLGKKIIDDLKRVSEPFGTKIEFVDGIGMVKLPPEATN